MTDDKGVEHKFEELIEAVMVKYKALLSKEGFTA